MTDLAQQAADRNRVRNQIIDCTACSLRAKAKAPVPFRGRAPARLMILGEAPGWEENIAGQPFVGASGKLLARLLQDAGLPRMSEMFIANTVCCRSQGPPENEHIMACMGNLRAQIALADPEWIVVLGNTALKALQTVKATISEVQGKPFTMPAGPAQGRWCFPLYHPAAALRDNSGRRQRDISSGLSDLARVLSGEVDRKVIGVRIGKGGKPQ